MLTETLPSAISLASAFCNTSTSALVWESAVLRSVFSSGSMGCSSSVVCSWITFISVGSTLAVLYCLAIILFALGGSTTGTSRCTPNAFFIDPLTSLYLGTFISAKDSNNTKKAINSVAISAKVAIHAGAPPPAQGGHFCGG